MARTINIPGRERVGHSQWILGTHIGELRHMYGEAHRDGTFQDPFQEDVVHDTRKDLQYALFERYDEACQRIVGVMLTYERPTPFSGLQKLSSFLEQRLNLADRLRSYRGTKETPSSRIAKVHDEALVAYDRGDVQAYSKALGHRPEYDSVHASFFVEIAEGVLRSAGSLKGHRAKSAQRLRTAYDTFISLDEAKDLEKEERKTKNQAFQRIIKEITAIVDENETSGLVEGLNGIDARVMLKIGKGSEQYFPRQVFRTKVGELERLRASRGQIPVEQYLQKAQQINEDLEEILLDPAVACRATIELAGRRILWDIRREYAAASEEHPVDPQRAQYLDSLREEIEDSLVEIKKVRDELFGSIALFNVSKALKGRRFDTENTDIVQHAHLGALRAIEKFDTRRGYSLGTYAGWFIGQSITRYIQDNRRTVRVPVHALEAINKITNAITRKEHELGRHLSPEEHDEIRQEAGMSESAYRNTLYAVKSSISLDAPMYDDEGATIADLLPSAAPSPEELLEASNERRLVNRMLASLNDPRKERILRKRFGIGDDKDQTLEELGQDYDLTRERIRQLERDGLNSLRHEHTKIKVTGAAELEVHYSAEPAE